MMKISTKTEYGMRCLLALARREAGTSVSISEIARQERVPKQYAQQILLRLRRAGIVVSSRGTQGGVALGRPADAISVGAILRVLEGIPFQETCNQFNKRSDCGHKGQCSIRPVWDIVSQRLWGALDQINLKQLLGEEHVVERTLIRQLPVLDLPGSRPA